MYLSGGLTLMLLITAVSVVFTSGALQEKVHYQYGADEQFVMSEDQNFVILLLDTVDSRTITELLDEHPEYSEVFRDFTYFEKYGRSILLHREIRSLYSVRRLV